MLLETSLEAEATSYTSLYFGGLEQVSDKCFTMMMVIGSKHWMVWSFSGLKICFCLHGFFVVVFVFARFAWEKQCKVDLEGQKTIQHSF